MSSQAPSKKTIWRKTEDYKKKDDIEKNLEAAGINEGNSLMLEKIDPKKSDGEANKDGNKIVQKEDERNVSNIPLNVNKFNALNHLMEESPRFTWCNNKSGGTRILERLGSPLVLNLCNSNSTNKRRIIFEDIWGSFPASFAVVKKKWNKKFSGDYSQILKAKCKRMLKALFFWSKAKLRNLEDLKSNLMEDILKLQITEAEVGWLSEDDCWKMKSKVAELNSTMARLCSWWKQRAKLFSIKWKQRSCNLDDWPNPCKILNMEEKDNLSKEFTVEEIEFVIKNLGNNIAPGSDGITYSFIKFYWNIVKEDFVNALNHFLNYGNMDYNWKYTLVVLIPKVSNPLMPSNYRPISLCNLVYKIAAKVILNRIMPVITLLISEEQATFIRGRSISDHILIAQEMFHKFRYSKVASGMVAYKVDMEQAYDSMSWKTLKQVLKYFEFPEMISNLILECVLDPRFSIMINGNPSGWIKAESGFRQGCPLSPILFIMCSQLVTSAFTNSSIGIGVCSNSPRISHLLFTDDVMVFSVATRKAVLEVKAILSKFSMWTGQKINTE
ncbi:hypothetical protein KFK09_028280 [Dendrobium nobile]|uniref:Reverse transcriptase domain-containing protein n=1 Tax=Dendrobium nobile TaxID=94219 RepID=A0A8T3A2Y0_DENNO|nr:hypothetical protein KFK09_028280 [Dendrobium nobile]